MAGNFVDFKRIKEQVSMEMVLDHYNIKLHRVNQFSLRGKCPLPAHTSETSTKSFSVQPQKNIWACQSASCAATRQGKKGGNMLDFVAMMESCSIREAALKLRDWFVSVAPSQSPATKTDRGKPTGKLVAQKKEGSEQTNKPLSFTLKDIDCSHPYLKHRGITEETAREFGVGFFPGRGSMSDRVVIPISNERGELVAYGGRSIDETEPKYKLPASFVKSAVLFNLHRVLDEPAENCSTGKDAVIVVEGFFDCMKVHQAGVPNVVALMGSSMSEAQQELLCRFKRVILFLDGDEPGRVAAQSIGARLMYQMLVQVVNLPDGKQPDQLSSDEIRAVLRV